MTYPARPLSDILDTATVDIPDRVATVFLGADLTYREIKRRSDRCAAALAGLGITKGDRIGIMLPNCPQYVIAAFAALRIGAIVVNINPTYTARELRGVIADSGLRILITLDVLAPLAADVRRQTALEHVIVTTLAEYSAQQGPPPRVNGTLGLTDLIEATDHAGQPPTSIASDDIAILQYTGGTTGTPKAAMLTHGNIFANVVQNETWLYRAYIRGEARYLIVIPYFHIYAFTVGMMSATWVGAQQIIIPKYDVEQVLQAIRGAPADVLPRRADHLRVAAGSTRAWSRSVWKWCGRSTPAARRARSRSSRSSSVASVGR